MQEWGQVKEDDLDNYGMLREAADEPPAGVPVSESPKTRPKQVFEVELTPKDKTTYPTGYSYVKPQVLRPRSPVRVFPLSKNLEGTEISIQRAQRSSIHLLDQELKPVLTHLWHRGKPCQNPSPGGRLVLRLHSKYKCPYMKQVPRTLSKIL